MRQGGPARREQNYANYKLEAYADAHLTPKGWAQSLALRDHIRTTGSIPDAVVVSPLTRTLETAAGAFGGPALGDDVSAAVLMRGQSALEGRRSRCPGFVLAPDGPRRFVAQELCREGYGLHPCDRRSPASEVKRAFPGVADWMSGSEALPEEDLLWSAESRESPDSVEDRARRFLAWLGSVEGSHVAVVSHAEFLGTLCYVLARHASDARHVEALTREFRNCEMRRVVVEGLGGGGGEMLVRWADAAGRAAMATPADGRGTRSVHG